MRLPHWTLLLSGMLFIASVWFALAARTGSSALTAAARVQPVATVKQLMVGIVGPASSTVYNSVSIVVSADGQVERYPKNDREWARVASSAASLAEVGGLLMAEGRARDSGRWMKISQALINASLVSMRAAEAEDKDALLASGEALNATCEDCHRIYSVDLPR